MRRSNAAAAFVLAGMMIVGSAQAAPLGYTLDVTTDYQFGAPGDLVAGNVANPDSGFFRVTNNGTTTFTGTLSLTAISGFNVDFSTSSAALTLAPGQSASISDASSESSNQGGFGGPFGGPQVGATLNIIGLIDGSEAVSLSVNDADVHSGVFLTNPLGELLDNFVFQGGSSTGGDTGDGFEVTGPLDAQSPGHFQFFERATTQVPEPGAIALLGTGLLLFARRRRVR